VAAVEGDLLGSDLPRAAIPHLGDEALKALLIPRERDRGFAVDPEVLKIGGNEG
jgi:hypothetical protein